MGYNSKQIKVEPLERSRKNPYNKDIIFDPEGQRNHPGSITKIPGNVISTEGYGYIPLYVVPNVGDPKMIYPNTGDYTFPGATSVTEYPQLDEMRYGGLKKGRKTSKNIFTSINDVMRRNETLYGKPGKRFYDPNYKEQGGPMNNDDFYIQHQDANRLRNDTPINFMPGPYEYGGEYKDGGNWIQNANLEKGRCTPGSPNYDCPKGSPQWNLAQTFKKYHGFRQEGGSIITPLAENPLQNFYNALDKYKTINPLDGKSANDVKSFIGKDIAPALKNYQKQLNDSLRTKYKMAPDAPITNQYLSPEEADTAVGGKYKDYMADFDAYQAYRAKTPQMPQRTVEGNTNEDPAIYGQRHVNLFNPYTIPKQVAGGEPCYDCDQQNMMGVGGSPFNYGAFPAMAYGGDIKNMINNIAKKQFGGTDAVGNAGPAPSIDSITGEKKNFFNNYIRNNVSKAMAEELHQEMMNQHMMPNGSMMSNFQMQTGGPTPPYAPGQTPPQVPKTPEGWGCSDQDKSTIGNPCYDANFANAQQNKGFDYSSREGSFNAQGNKTADPYGKVPTVDPYFASENPQSGFDNVNVQPNTPTFQLDNQDAPQVDQENQIEMDPDQMRTDQPAPTPEITSPQGPGASFTASFSGTDMADKIIGGMNFVSGFLENRDRRRQEKKNAWRFSGDANFQPMPEQSNSRGDYDPNSGMFRPNQYVPVQYAGTNYGNIGSNMYAQYGGSGFNQGDEVYMTDDEVQNYLKAGGQVQFLD